jgi:hypothetical protein
LQPLELRGVYGDLITAICQDCVEDDAVHRNNILLAVIAAVGDDPMAVRGYKPELDRLIFAMGTDRAGTDIHAGKFRHRDVTHGAFSNLASRLTMLSLLRFNWSTNQSNGASAWAVRNRNSLFVQNLRG